ncbi:hypothetical protein D910_00874 [Dendroctonus ponderosae]
MKLILAISVLCVASLAVEAASNETNNFCYFESWTVYRPGNGTFDVEDIDTSLCTHIAFAFLGINQNGKLKILDPWESNPDGLNGFERFVNLTSQNSSLKVLASLSGWNEGSGNYSKVVANPTKRALLVNTTLDFLGTYGFDGLDFSWTYPSREDSNNPDDNPNFVLMLQELKTAFEPHGYLLSAAVNSAKKNIDVSYNVSSISAILDFINVMAFDFHGSFDNYVGHHTLLYSSEVDALYNNSDWNIICETYPDAEDIWNDVQNVPHLVIGDQWIGYDNEKSIGIKVDYALEKSLGGFMVWSFDTDDFTGNCGKGTYPLINSIHSNLKTRGYKMKTNK